MFVFESYNHFTVFKTTECPNFLMISFVYIINHVLNQLKKQLSALIKT